MEVYEITPASAKPVIILVTICIVVLVIVSALAFTAYASRNSAVELSGAGIRIVGDFWGRSVALDHIKVPEARLVDLGQDPGLALKWRTWGTALPGYRSGWFRLRNGDKALVYLTRSTRIAYVPTTEGYSLLLSVDAPDRFLQRLRAHSE